MQHQFRGLCVRLQLLYEPTRVNRRSATGARSMSTNPTEGPGPSTALRLQPPVRNTSANGGDVFVFSARGLPALAYPDWPQVVLGSLEHLALALRESSLVQHKLQRTIVPVSNRGRRRGCSPRAQYLSFDFNANPCGRPINRRMHPRVFRPRPNHAGRMKTDDNAARSRVRLGSASARFETYGHRCNADGERTEY